MCGEGIAGETAIKLTHKEIGICGRYGSDKKGKSYVTVLNLYIS
jgi:hypothetical protein